MKRKPATGALKQRWQDALAESKSRNKISESDLQAMCAAWLDTKGLCWAHPTNEQKDPTALGKAKKHGLKAGLPDILIFTVPPRFPNCRGVAIELKIKPNKLSAAQIHWQNALIACDWWALVCFDFSEFLQDMKRLGFA